MKKHKKILEFLILSLIILTVIFPVNVNAATKLNKKSIMVNVNKTYTLKVYEAKHKVKWSSSDRKIATVNSKGVVKGIKKGKCNITAKVGKKIYVCKVIVKRPAKKKSWDQINKLSMLSYNNLEFCTDLQNDSFGNSYNGNNIIKLKTYGEAIWGEYGYDGGRIGYGEFLLNNVYSKLVGRIAVSAETSNESVGGRLEIYGDDHLLSFYDLNRKSAPIDLNINVTGVKILKISLVYRSKEGYGEVKVLLDNVKVKRGNYVEAPSVEETKLVDMNIINKYKDYNIIADHTRTDLFGNTYSPENLLQLSVYGEYIWGNNGSNSVQTPYGEYCINKKYSTLNGTIVLSDTSDDVQGRFVIYGDNQEIYSQYLNKSTMPINLNMSVNSYTWIKFAFEFNSSDAAGTAKMYMANFVLK